MATFNGEPSQAEIDLERLTWHAAREQFRFRKIEQRHGKTADVEEFLQSFTTIEKTRQHIISARETASTEYSGRLGGILDNIEVLMRIGDIAMKTASESIGLAWTGIRLCLNAVQDDFATFGLFSSAANDMLAIMISCRVYGKMYGNNEGPEDFQELHDKVLEFIPRIYNDMIYFSWKMWKYAGTPKGFRIAKGIFRSAVSELQPIIQTIRDNEVKMNGYATQAAQRLSVHYTKQGLSNDRAILDTLSQEREILEASAKETSEIRRWMEQLDQERRVQAKKTPHEVALDVFNKHKKDLNITSSPAAALEEKKGLRRSGTCQWIYSTDEYKAWQSAESGSILWISGDGGSGKSFLMSSIIEGLQVDFVDAVVSFFFIDNTDDATSRTERIHSHLLFSLYEQAQTSLDLLDKANEIVDRFIRQRSANVAKASAEKTKSPGQQDMKEGSSFEETYLNLVKAINKTVYLAVDALDECSDRVAQGLVPIFRRLTESQDCIIKTLVTSRPEEDISTLFMDISNVDVEKNNEQDISTHVRGEMEKLPGFSSAERDLAVEQITHKAGSYFRYVPLAMDFMRQPWQRPLTERLQHLPQGLENIYAQRLQQTDPAYLGFLQTCLTWSLLAVTDVHVAEVVDAFSKTYTSEALDEVLEDDDNETMESLHEEQILKAGGAFLKIDKETKSIIPVHNTVKDFFVKSESYKLDQGKNESPNVCPHCHKVLGCSVAHKDSPSSFVISERSGHLSICTTILQHLMSPVFRKRYGAGALEPAAAEMFAEDMKRKGDDTNEHVSKTTSEDQATAGADADTLTPQVATESSSDDKTNGELSEPLYTTNADQDSYLKHVQNSICVTNESDEDKATEGLSELGLEEKLQTTTAGPSGTPTESTEEGKTENDLERHVELQEGTSSSVNSDVTEDVSEQPVQVAADDLEEIESNADSDMAGDEGESNALYKSEFDAGKLIPTWRYEHTQLLYHLIELERVWPYDSREGDEWLAFKDLLLRFFDINSSAFREWAWFCAQYLLDDLGYLDKNGITPLHFATRSGLVSLTRLCLERKDDVNAQTETGRTPLHLALDPTPGLGRNDEIVKLLIEHGTNLNVPSNYYQRPMNLWLRWGNPAPTKELVELMLAHGAQLEELDEGGMTALHAYTLGLGGLDIAHVLLKGGAKANTRSSWGETPLHTVLKRHVLDLDVVRLFIDEGGADINEDDDASQRPLFEAASFGTRDAVELLLERGADIEDDDADGLTALHAAANRGDADIVQILLEKKADITKLDKFGRTPFLVACKSSEPAAAVFLAKHLASTDVSLLDKAGTNGKTPLRRAAARNYTEIMKIILEHCDGPSAVSTVDDKLHRTPLHWAALNAHEEAVDILLSKGAQPRAIDRRGLTPLQLCYKHYFARKSKAREEVVIKLIDADKEAAAADIDLLNTAATAGSVPLITKLLHIRADPYRKDEHGWTALQLARQYGRDDVEKAILSKDMFFGIKPTKWQNRFPASVLIEDDGRSATYVKARSYGSEIGIIADHPVPAGTDRYYYEITIDDPENKNPATIVAMGICHRPTRLTSWVPGWSSPGASSWAYHGDDSGIAVSDPEETIRDRGNALKYGHGDTVGCGIEFRTRSCFFTLNGVRLMKAAFQNVHGRVYPAIGVADNVKVTANFGSHESGEGFMWKPGNHLQFEDDVPPPSLKRTITGKSFGAG